MSAPLWWWIGTTGCTAYTPEGERLTVTGVNRTPDAVGAFARSDEGDRMYYAEFSSADDRYGTVARCYEINRDAFDYITGLSDLRRELGWAA